MDGYILIGFTANILTTVGLFFWLHRDIADLRERMAKLEGAMDGFTKGVQALAKG